MPKDSDYQWVVEPEHFTLCEDGKYTCVHCVEAKKEGKREKVWRTPRHPSNMHVHLGKHHPTVQRPTTSTLTQTKIDNWCLPYMTTNEQWALAFAVGGVSFNVASTMPFKSVLAPTMPARVTLAKATETVAAKLRKAALEKLTNVTLCIDGGTVFNRYLLIAAASPGKAVIIKCTAVDNLPDKKMTSESISSELKKVTKDIVDAGGHVVEIVADNAANMQGAVTSDVHKTRCTAHVFQLALKDMMNPDSGIEQVRDGIATVDVIAERAKVDRCPETRWSYMLKRAESAKKFATDAELLRIIPLTEILRPFAVATDRVQSDWATMWTALVQWEMLLGECAECVRQITTNRFHYWLREAVLIVAYFAPHVVMPPQSAEFDDLVTEAVKKYDAAAAKDLEAYFNWANRSERKQELRLSDYTVYLKTILAPKFPALAGLIARLLNTTPTEASVERGFSQMKHCVNDWRNRLDVETVESILVAKSCYASVGHRAATAVHPRPTHDQKFFPIHCVPLRSMPYHKNEWNNFSIHYVPLMISFPLYDLNNTQPAELVSARNLLQRPKSPLHRGKTVS
jgi:hypothetical protein